MSDQLKEWDEATPKKDISIKEMTQLIEFMREAREDYERKKKASNDAHALYKEKQQAVIDAMLASGQKNFSVAGLGQCIITEKLNFKTPKTVESKRELFNYITKEYGRDFLIEMMSINANTLKKFANEEMAAKGLGELPGLDAPTVEHSTQWRSEKK